MLESSDIEDWHRTIFSSIVPLDYYAGNFRQRHNEMVCLGIDVHVGGIPAISFHRVLAAMATLNDQLRKSLAQTELRWEVLTPEQRAHHVAGIAAVLIGTFIRVHPFRNGNGRLSRLI